MSQCVLAVSALFDLTPPVIAGIVTFIIINAGWVIYVLTSKGMKEKRAKERLEKEAQMQRELEMERQILANQAAQRERELENQRQIKREVAKNLEVSGRYEEAARCYDELEMYEKAGECRRLARTSYQISTAFSMGKDGAISVNCPNCGSSQAVESKQNLVICKHCGHNYIIPKKVLDMM